MILFGVILDYSKIRKGKEVKITDKLIQSTIKSVLTETNLCDGADGRGTGSLNLYFLRGVKGVTASWLVQWKREGQRQKVTIGRYPELSLRDARLKFQKEISPHIQAGLNPRSLAAKHESPTVEALFKAYIAAMREAGKRSAVEVERALLTATRCAADVLGRKSAAASITPGDITRVLAGMYSRDAKVGADRTRAYLSAAFNWGLKAANDYRVKDRQAWGYAFNPVAAVVRDTGVNKTRERTLSEVEIRALWADLLALNGFSLQVANAVFMLLCCGQRVRETLRARGEHIDLAAMTWTLPRDTTKGGKQEHTIPLPDQAIKLISMASLYLGTGNMFPARSGSTSGTISDSSINNALRRWTEKRGFEPMQTRDIRRTWKSRAADAGVDRFTRDLIQQHTSGDTGSKFYDRADYRKQMREGMDLWSKWLYKVTQDEPVSI